MDIPPQQTIYVQNLYEKLSKEELKKCIYALFSQFGKIVDVVALKTTRLRGQAWIVFSEKIAFARTKSDAVSKLDGSYKLSKAERSKKNAAAKEAMLKRGQERAAGSAPATAQRATPSAPASNAAPNKILFVEGLPEATNDAMLGMLFQQFTGFKEVRMVEARPGIAFVEFDNEMQSGVALSGLQGFKITPTHAMAITFAKA
eukprot:gene4578-14759_t